MEATDLFGRGLQCCKSGKYSEAIECFNNSLSIYQERGDQEMIAWCYYGLGGYYHMLDKYSEAVTYYELSLKFKEKCNQEMIAQCDYGLGECYRMINRQQEAKEYIDKALIIAEQFGYWKVEWLCNHRLSTFHFNQKQFQEALDYAKRALDIANKMNSTKEKKISYKIYGHALASLGKVKEAIDYVERYLEYTKRVGNRKEEGRTFYQISLFYRNIHDYDISISYAEKSAAIARETGDLETEGKAYATIGNARLAKGKVKESMEYYMKQLEIATQICDKQLEAIAYNSLATASKKLSKYCDAIRYFEATVKLTSELGLENNNSAKYNNLGFLYYKVGKYHEAGEFLKQCLDMVKDTGEISIEALAYHQLSNVYYKLNNFKLAGECSLKSTILAIRIKEKHGEVKYFQDVGRCFSRTKKITETITSYKKALHLALKIKPYDLIWVCYRNLGQTYFQLDMVHEAIHVFEKGLTICIEDKEQEAHSYSIMGTIYHSLARKQKICNDHVQYDQNIKTSEQYLRESLHFYEELFDDLREKHEFKISIVDTYVEAYDELALLLIDTKRTTEALIVCERGRACALGDTLVCKYGIQQQQVFVENIPTRQSLNENDLTDLVPEESSLLFYSIIRDSDRMCMWVLSQKSLIYAQNDMQKNSITNKNITKYIKQLVDSAYKYMGVRQMAANCEDRSLGEQEPCYSEGDDDQSQLSNSIARRTLEQDIIDSGYSRRNPKERRRNPPESTSTESDQHIDTKEPLKELFLIKPVQEHLTQDEVINIPNGSLNMEPCYIEGDDDRLPLSNSIARRPLEQDNIDTEYSRGNPKKRTRNPPESTSIGSDQHIDTKEPLKELFKQLITPVQEQLTKDEVIIIPDGPLNMVPFAALQDPQTGRFLCETKQIRLAPSLATLKTIKGCPDDYHSKTGALVVGNPCVGKVIFRRKKTTISRLPGAEKEAQNIGQILNVSPLIGKAATKDAVKEKLQEDAAVIHIAAHGDDATGEIALAPGISAQSKAIPEEEDYILTMQEVQEIGVRAKLVVLSCCHSGRGEIRAEGVVGMARAFLAAGARAVVASLWAIDDEATLDFMCHFYRQLKLGKSASVSLKNSMKKMIDGDGEEKRYSNPEYWAPFFLIGDDVTIYKVNDRSVNI